MDALEQVGPGGRILFSKLLHEEMERHEIVVTFLAILELMKMKQILCYQEKLFEDIVMEWRGKNALMDYPKLKSIIEGLLFLAGEEGLSVRQIAEITEQSDGLVGEALEDMKEEWERYERGIQIVQIAGSYKIATLAEHAPYFERLAYSPSRSSLSQAALETLSIVAYRQPITRVEIEDIRSVKSERAIHTLVSKGLIEEVGRAEAIGRPILYGTTKLFLDYFGLANIKDLPEPSQFEDNDSLKRKRSCCSTNLTDNSLRLMMWRKVNHHILDKASLENGPGAWIIRVQDLLPFKAYERRGSNSFASFGDAFAILSQADYILLSSFWGLLREDMDLSYGRSGRSPYRIADRCSELEGHD